MRAMSMSDVPHFLSPLLYIHSDNIYIIQTDNVSRRSEETFFTKILRYYHATNIISPLSRTCDSDKL